MLLKLKIYKIPTRTLPLQINTLRAGTITKRKAPISIIRSPHIDKRSWEHFQFFITKKITVIKQKNQLNLALNFTKRLKLFFSVLRCNLSILYFTRFTTQF